MAHGVSDIGVGGARFAGEVPDAGTLGRMADIVIRSQGLQAWTEKPQAGLHDGIHGARRPANRSAVRQGGSMFRNFLDRYGFTADDGTKSGSRKRSRGRGQILRPTAVEDQALGDRLLGQFWMRGAMPFGAGYSRAVATAGAQRGTFAGEMGRNLSLFKSFPMAMSLMHGVRSYQLLKGRRGAGGGLCHADDAGADCGRRDGAAGQSRC